MIVAMFRLGGIVSSETAQRTRSGGYHLPYDGTWPMFIISPRWHDLRGHVRQRAAPT